MQLCCAHFFRSSRDLSESLCPFPRNLVHQVPGSTKDTSLSSSVSSSPPGRSPVNDLQLNVRVQRPADVPVSASPWSAQGQLRHHRTHTHTHTHHHCRQQQRAEAAAAEPTRSRSLEAPPDTNVDSYQSSLKDSIRPLLSDPRLLTLLRPGRTGSNRPLRSVISMELESRIA